ncbi:MAG: rhomboid family intramembrane serine protease [Chitinophagaceae bacterium]
MEISITFIIIIITALVSIGGFNNARIIDDLIFYPPAVSERNQWYRFFSCGIIHADWGHLIFNMYALYMFGAGKNGVEDFFRQLFGSKGPLLYLAMYIVALAICLIPTYIKHKHNYAYRSLGASGAVSAVVFAYVLFNPMARMGIMFIPIMIPGFIFGILYLVISSWLAKRGRGNINHSAHIWGAIFGVVFVAVACLTLSDYPVLQIFVEEIKNLDPSKIITFGGGFR